MLATKLQDKKNEEGFTLIELLVVVIIIGILAAIAIPAFLNQRQSAWERAATSDARNAAIAIETFYTQEDGYPPDANWVAGPNNLVELGGGTDVVETVMVSNDVRLAYDNLDNGTYTITATHAQIGATEYADTVAIYNSATGGITTP